jgi:hypothetical protein
MYERSAINKILPNQSFSYQKTGNTTKISLFTSLLSSFSPFSALLGVKKQIEIEHNTIIFKAIFCIPKTQTMDKRECQTNQKILSPLLLFLSFPCAMGVVVLQGGKIKQAKHEVAQKLQSANSFGKDLEFRSNLATPTNFPLFLLYIKHNLKSTQF